MIVSIRAQEVPQPPNTVLEARDWHSSPHFSSGFTPLIVLHELMRAKRVCQPAVLCLPEAKQSRNYSGGGGGVRESRGLWEPSKAPGGRFFLPPTTPPPDLRRGPVLHPTFVPASPRRAAPIAGCWMRPPNRRARMPVGWSLRPFCSHGMATRAGIQRDVNT